MVCSPGLMRCDGVFTWFDVGGTFAPESDLFGEFGIRGIVEDVIEKTFVVFRQVKTRHTIKLHLARTVGPGGMFTR